MNSFDNSDQQDFDKILESTERINTTVEQNTGILSKIQDGVGAVGNGIANIYRNNKEDYGINMPQVRQNVATMSGGPLAAVINDALANVGLDMGSIIKNSIGNLIDRFHGHSDNFEAGDIAAGFEPVMKQQIAQGNEQIGIAKQHIQEDKQDTNRKIANDNANTERIIRKMDDLSIELTGSQSGRTGKRGAGIGGGGGLHGGNVRNVQVLGGGSAGTSSTQSLNQITALLNAILNGQQQLNGIFVDPDADKGGWFSIIKEFGGMWKGIKFWMNGRYARDIPRSQNPLETMTNALLKIYEWERIGIDLSRRQLNELIKASGGQQQTYFGHEGALKTYLKKKTNELKNAIDSKYGADSFTGKSLKGIVNAAAFFAKFTDEDFKDDRFAQAHNALRSMGRRKNQMEGKINTFDEYQTRQYLDSLGIYGSAPEIDQAINNLFSKQGLERQKLVDDIKFNGNVMDQLDAFNKINKNAVGPGRKEAVRKAYDNLVRTIKTEQENLGFSGLHVDPLEINIPRTMFGNADVDAIDPSHEYTMNEIIKDPMKQILDAEAAKLMQLRQELATQEEFLRKTGHYNTNSSRSVDEIKKEIDIIEKNQYDRIPTDKAHARIGDTVIPVTIINPSKRIASQLRQKIGSGVSDQSMAFSNNVIVGLNRLAELLGGNGTSLAEELVMALEASKNGIAVRNIHDEDYDRADVDLNRDILDEINAERRNNGAYDSTGIANAIIAADQNTNARNLRGEYTVEGEQLEAQQQQAKVQQEILELLRKKGILTADGDGKGSSIFDILAKSSLVGLGAAILKLAGIGTAIYGGVKGITTLLDKVYNLTGDNGSYIGDHPATALGGAFDLAGGIRKVPYLNKVPLVGKFGKLAGGIGTALDVYDGTNRALDGQYVRGANQIANGVLNWIPGYGWVTSIGGHAATAYGDAVAKSTGSEQLGEDAAKAAALLNAYGVGGGATYAVGKGLQHGAAVLSTSGKYAGEMAQYGKHLVDAGKNFPTQVAGWGIEKTGSGLQKGLDKLGNSKFLGTAFDKGGDMAKTAGKAAGVAGGALGVVLNSADMYGRIKNDDIGGAALAGLGAVGSGAGMAGALIGGSKLLGPVGFAIGGVASAGLAIYDDFKIRGYTKDLINNDAMLNALGDADYLSVPENKEFINSVLHDEDLDGSDRAKKIARHYNNWISENGKLEIFERLHEAGKNKEFLMDARQHTQAIKEVTKNIPNGQIRNNMVASMTANLYEQWKKDKLRGVDIESFHGFVEAAKNDQKFENTNSQVKKIKDAAKSGKISNEEANKQLFFMYDVYQKQQSGYYKELGKKPKEEKNGIVATIEDVASDLGKLGPTVKDTVKGVVETTVDSGQAIIRNATENTKSIVDAILSTKKEVPRDTSSSTNKPTATSGAIKGTATGVAADGTPFVIGEKGEEYVLPINDSKEAQETLTKIGEGVAEKVGLKKFAKGGKFGGKEGLVPTDDTLLDDVTTKLSDSIKGTPGVLNANVSGNQSLPDVFHEAEQERAKNTEKVLKPLTKDVNSQAQTLNKDIKPTMQRLDKNISTISEDVLKIASSAGPELGVGGTAKGDYYKRDKNGNVETDEKGNPVIDEEKKKKEEEEFIEKLKKEGEKKNDIFDIAYYDDEQKFQEELAKVGNEKRKKQLIEGRARVLDARETTGNTYEQDEEFSGPKIDKDLLQFRKDFVGPELPDEERAKLEQEKSLAETAKEVQEQEAGEIDIDSYPDDTLLDDIPGLAKHEGSSLDFLRPSAKVGEEVEGEETFLDEDGKRTQVVNETGKSAAGSQNVTYTEKNVGDIFKELGISDLKETLPDPNDRLAFLQKLEDDEQYKKYHDYAQNVAKVHGNDFHTYESEFMYGKNVDHQAMADGMTSNNREAVLKRIYANLPEDMPKEQKAFILENANLSFGQYKQNGLVAKTGHEYSDALRGINAIENPEEVVEDQERQTPTSPAEAAIEAVNSKQYEGSDDTLLDDVADEVTTPEVGSEVEGTPEANTVVNADKKQGVIQDQAKATAKEITQVDVKSESKESKKQDQKIQPKSGELQKVVSQIKQLNPDADVNSKAIEHYGLEKIKKNPWLATVDFLDDPDSESEAKEIWDLETKSKKIRKTANAKTGDVVDSTLVGGEVTEIKLSKKTEDKQDNTAEIARDVIKEKEIQTQDAIPENDSYQIVDIPVTELTPTETIEDLNTPQIGTEVDGEVFTNPIDISSQTTGQIKDAGSREAGTVQFADGGITSNNDFDKYLPEEYRGKGVKIDLDTSKFNGSKNLSTGKDEHGLKTSLGSTIVPMLVMPDGSRIPATGRLAKLLSLSNQIDKSFDKDLDLTSRNYGDYGYTQHKFSKNHNISSDLINQAKSGDTNAILEILKQREQQEADSILLKGGHGLDDMSTKSYDFVAKKKAKDTADLQKLYGSSDPKKYQFASKDPGFGFGVNGTRMFADGGFTQPQDIKEQNITQVAQDISAPVTGTEVDGETPYNPIEVTSKSTGQIKDAGSREAGTVQFADGGILSNIFGSRRDDRAIKISNGPSIREIGVDAWVERRQKEWEDSKTIFDKIDDVGSKIFDNVSNAVDSTFRFVTGDRENIATYKLARILADHFEKIGVDEFINSDNRIENMLAAHPLESDPGTGGSILGAANIAQLLLTKRNPEWAKAVANSRSMSFDPDEFMKCALNENAEYRHALGADDIKFADGGIYDSYLPSHLKGGKIVLDTDSMSGSRSVSVDTSKGIHDFKKSLSSTIVPMVEMPDGTRVPLEGELAEALRLNTSIEGRKLSKNHNLPSELIKRAKGRVLEEDGSGFYRDATDVEQQSAIKEILETRLGKKFADGGLSEGYSSVPVHEGNTLWGEGKSGLGGAEFKLAMDNGSSAFLPVSSREGTLTSKVKKYITEGVKNGGKVEGPKQLATGTIMGTDSKIDSSARALAQELISDVRFSDGGISDSTPEFGGAPRAASLNTQGIREATSAESTEHAINGLREEIASNTQNVIASNTTMKSMVSKGGSVVNHNTTINNNPDTHYLQAMGLAHSNPNVVP